MTPVAFLSYSVPSRFIDTLYFSYWKWHFSGSDITVQRVKVTLKKRVFLELDWKLGSFERWENTQSYSNWMSPQWLLVSAWCKPRNFRPIFNHLALTAISKHWRSEGERGVRIRGADSQPLAADRYTLCGSLPLLTETTTESLGSKTGLHSSFRSK